MIADFLLTSKIRYEYETPIKLGNKCFYPDFFLPDYSIYIEYFGMIRDPEYAYKTQLKKIAYHEHKLDVIGIYPQHLSYLGTIINQRILHKSGKMKETGYISLTKKYVPKPISREWVDSRKVRMQRPKYSFRSIIGRFFGNAPHRHF